MIRRASENAKKRTVAVASLAPDAALRRAMLAGAFMLGIVQQLSIWSLDPAWQNGIVFLVLVVFLTVRPTGLFGPGLATRQA